MIDRYLVLIRHGLPLKDAYKSPKDWTLSEAGEEQSRRLARHFMQKPVDTFIFCSDEMKAVKTAEIIAKSLSRTVQKNGFLREIDRRPTPNISKEEFARLNIEMFRTPYQPVVGEESSDMAKTRFSDGIKEALDFKADKWEEGDRLVVAHGTVIALFLAEYNDINPIEFWARFNCTDYVRVSLPDFKIMDIFKNT